MRSTETSASAGEVSGPSMGRWAIPLVTSERCPAVGRATSSTAPSVGTPARVPLPCCLTDFGGPADPNPRRRGRCPGRRPAGRWWVDAPGVGGPGRGDGAVATPVSYTHLRAHETPEHLVCRLLLDTRDS